MTLLALVLLLGLAPAAAAAEDERLDLSGRGTGDAVPWDFFMTGGRGAGFWTTIPVPSQWEQQGFGTYAYGHDERKARDRGLYRHRFTVPAAWRDRRVDLVFEGVMTDARVSLNGRSAGPVHQGGFYRFRYPVAELLRYGEENVLEVEVDEHSADGSVNRAERDADYWVFGGIYRPVYLLARPAEGVATVAVDARADGTLRARVELSGGGWKRPGRLRVTLAGEPGAGMIEAAVEADESTVELAGRFAGVGTWSAESPRLYRLSIEALRDGRVLHRHEERIGFRTVEVRPGAGLYVNGRRVLLKGVNRHAFWPRTGRTLSPALDRRDARRIQAMNLNAVRTAHYPPDPSFLDACDELGIYVIDELAGWHDAYRMSVGRHLVREMVERDRNHPSILFWANGNEGGWNEALDPLFAAHDLARRPVLHPDETAGGVDTTHYPTWSELREKLEGASLGDRWRRLFGPPPLVMPTELLHGLYDGGSGASLEDFWSLLRASPRAAGAFLWSFSDESIARTDRGGRLDSDGNHAPDGVLGPFREPEASFYTLRDVFSPVALETATVEDGRVRLVNRFDETDLADIRLRWSYLDLPSPGAAWAPARRGGGEVPGPAAPPGATAELELPPAPADADAVELTARLAGGRELSTWVLPLDDPRGGFLAFADAAGPAATLGERGGRIVLAAAGVRAEIDRASGELVSLGRGGQALALGRGPRFAGDAEPPAASVRRGHDGDAAWVEAEYGDVENGLERLRWTLFPSGWLRLELRYRASGRREMHGVYFEYPRERLRRFRWLGQGPARVWRNRLRGGRLGVWTRRPGTGRGLELEGFYRGVVWAELAEDGGRLLVAPGSDELYLSLFVPRFPDDARDAVASPPPGGLGLYHGIPAIGTKFHPPAELGPSGRPYEEAGIYEGVVWLTAGKESNDG